MDLHSDIGAIWSASDLDTASKAVLTVVRYHADDEGNCRITVDQIAKFTSMHRTGVIRRMADLVARKLIEREIDRRGGNVYRVRPDGWQMDQSSLTATTVVAHSDHSSRTQLLQKSHTATTVVADSDHRTIEVVNCSHVATEQQERVVVAREDKAPAAPSPTTTPSPATPTNEPNFAAVVEAYRLAMQPTGNRGVGMFMPPALVPVVAKMVDDFTPTLVLSAIEAAVDAKGCVPGPAYVRKICERFAAEQRRPAALPFRPAPVQVEEPMSDEEKRRIMDRLMALEIP